MIRVFSSSELGFFASYPVTVEYCEFCARTIIYTFGLCSDLINSPAKTGTNHAEMDEFMEQAIIW